MKLIKYLQEVKLELSKITWPSRSEATKMTIIVVGASFAVGLYIGGLDLGLTSLLGLFIK